MNLVAIFVSISEYLRNTIPLVRRSKVVKLIGDLAEAERNTAILSTTVDNLEMKLDAEVKARRRAEDLVESFRVRLRKAEADVVLAETESARLRNEVAALKDKIERSREVFKAIGDALATAGLQCEVTQQAQAFNSYEGSVSIPVTTSPPYAFIR